MTKISNDIVYIVDTNVSDLDSLIGTDGDTTAKRTKNFLLGQLQSYFTSGLSPLTGGVLRFTEITYSGNLYATHAAVLNNLDPVFVVDQYHIVVVNLNGKKSILKLQNRSVGIDLPLVLTTDFISLSSKNLIFSDQGASGESVVRDVQETESSTTVRMKNINSTSLTITATDTEVTINTPSSATIPALYVNNLYIPTYEDFLAGNTKGTGTIAKPFTDTISYTTPTTFTVTANSSIQNALDAYVGSGTRLNPQKFSQEIVIQNNNSSYTFNGDFNYSLLNLKILGNVISLKEDYLIDMDNSTFFKPNSDRVNIYIEESVFLFIYGKGLKNSGSNINTNIGAQSKFVRIKGKGVLQGASNDINKYLLSADPLSTLNSGLGHNNDGEACFFIGNSIVAEAQSICSIGGRSRIIFQECSVRSGSSTQIDNTIVAFYQTGGELVFINCGFALLGVARSVGFVFSPIGSLIPKFTCVNTSFSGFCSTWFYKNNVNTVVFSLIGSSTLYFGGTQLFNSANLWPVNFRNNIFENTNIDFNKVDLTQGNTVSSINTIGGNIIETLVSYPSKEAANIGSLSKMSAFTNKKTVVAGTFVVGVEYKIATLGDTNFTLVGASGNTVGLYFTATGAGIGTGTVYLYTRDILN
jgi:hypothetical protein